MPIRMVDDPNDRGSNENDDIGGGGRGGGGGLIQFLPMILGLLIRKPALLLVVIAIGGFMYLKNGCNGLSSLNNQLNNTLSTGGVLDPREFAKADVYEALDADKTQLPENISLLNYAPERLNQGQQGSCVAWSSAYAARTILEATSTSNSANQIAFSPAFMYNQIGLDGCQGSYIIRAMENLTKVGAVPFNAFPYDDKDCSRQPGEQLKQAASQYRMLGFTRLTGDEGTRQIDIRAIKEHLAKEVPVVIGMMVGGSFMQEMQGQEVWHPNQDDYSQMGFGGHAMCVIGYDDRKEGGAFQIMNSWGNDWGVNGIAWVKYKDFKYFVREAYGLNPMPRQAGAEAQTLSCQIGLVNADTKAYIPLQNTGANIFMNTVIQTKGTSFKVEVKNKAACYVYVIGKETDGSSYILFPYPSKDDATKTKFSPYCGITGYRLFPRGMKMQLDSIGNRDYMAVITSTEALDIFELNKAVNQNKNLGFENAVNAALGNQRINNIRFSTTSDGTIGFETANNKQTAVVCIVAINKN